MEEITFTHLQANRIYAIKNTNGRLVEIKKPHTGQKVFEFVIFLGG